MIRQVRMGFEQDRDDFLFDPTGDREPLEFYGVGELGFSLNS